MLREFENHNQWNSVKEVCKRLKEAGFQALLAGGCVRDMLMNREPNDFDIATDATPDQVHELYPKALTVGKAFGVTILPYSGYQLEVATFRIDLEYKDGRRPDGVQFSTPEEDAKRRDFTINALFMDPETGQVIDFVDGVKDIHAKIIRTVGDPKKRFDEDRLRIMRAIRFAAQLDFAIEADTLASVIELAPEVAKVSRERIRDEVFKLLKAPARVKGLELAISTGVLEAEFPTLAPLVFQEETRWLERFEILSALMSPMILDQRVQAALFFYPAWKESESKAFRDHLMEDLRIDNQLADSVVFALKHQVELLNPANFRRGEIALILAHEAGAAAQFVASVVERAESVQARKNLLRKTERELLLEMIAESSLLNSKDKPKPFLSGHDLKVQGIPAGPKMGEILHEAMLLQLEGVLKSPDEALEWLKGQKV